MENKELVVQKNDVEPRSASDIRVHINLIQEVMKSVMQKDQHYGIIPGCGDKPTLLKAGAEKLMATFRLSPKIIVDDLSSLDERRYRITVELYTPNGVFCGAGVGEASSLEEKFAWKKAACDEEFNETREDRRRQKWFHGKNGTYQIKQVRTNPADQANTVLKISKKRGLVDAVLTATAASDIFTQDIEEMAVETQTNKPVQSQIKTGVITEAQRKRMFAIAKANKVADETLHQIVYHQCGVNHSDEILRKDYESICNILEDQKNIEMIKATFAQATPGLEDTDPADIEGMS